MLKDFMLLVLSESYCGNWTPFINTVRRKYEKFANVVSTKVCTKIFYDSSVQVGLSREMLHPTTGIVLDDNVKTLGKIAFFLCRDLTKSTPKVNGSSSQLPSHHVNHVHISYQKSKTQKNIRYSKKLTLENNTQR